MKKHLRIILCSVIILSVMLMTACRDNISEGSAYSSEQSDTSVQYES